MRDVGVIRLTYHFIASNPFGCIMLLELLLISLTFGMAYGWLVFNLIDSKDSDFVIFESSAELQEACWSGLRHGDK